MRSERLTHRRLTVPFFDLEPSHAGIRGAIARDIEQLIADGTFTNGRQVAEFEQAFAAYCGAGTASGSRTGSTLCGSRCSPQASSRAMRSSCPADTFVATLEAVTQAGGGPCSTDIGEMTTASTSKPLEAAIGPNTRCPLPCTSTGRWRTCAPLDALAGRTSCGRRGRVPGARRDARRPAGRSRRASRGLQLLPGEEPRRNG